MFHTSHIEISRSSYKKNIEYLRRIVGKQTVISSVIKGNAYGHGIDNMVKLAEKEGLSHFSVFSAYEALMACKVKAPRSDVMIMGMTDDPELEWAIENNVEFYVFDQGRLEKAMELARKIQKKARIHIEVETGFNRTGFDFRDLPKLFKVLSCDQENFKLEGLCTHYAGAESISNYVRIREQIGLYRKFYNQFVRHGITPLRKHTACSAAVLTYPVTIMDLVRVGIAQYGFWPSPETKMYRFRKEPIDENHLSRLISWKSKVMAVKDVEAGQYIGYGSSYLANKKTSIAIIPVGYSNGFSRALSNTGRVLIRGQRVPVIGTVTMNTLTVNVSDIPGVQRGDEVVIIGKQKRMNISVASFSEMSDQLNYQTLTRIPSDIPRKLVK